MASEPRWNALSGSGAWNRGESRHFVFRTFQAVWFFFSFLSRRRGGCGNEPAASERAAVREAARGRDACRPQAAAKFRHLPARIFSLQIQALNCAGVLFGDFYSVIFTAFFSRLNFTFFGVRFFGVVIFAFFQRWIFCGVIFQR